MAGMLRRYFLVAFVMLIIIGITHLNVPQSVELVMDSLPGPALHTRLPAVQSASSRDSAELAIDKDPPVRIGDDLDDEADGQGTGAQNDDLLDADWADDEDELLGGQHGNAVRPTGPLQDGAGQADADHGDEADESAADDSAALPTDAHSAELAMAADAKQAAVDSAPFITAAPPADAHTNDTTSGAEAADADQLAADSAPFITAAPPATPSAVTSFADGTDKSTDERQTDSHGAGRNEPVGGTPIDSTYRPTPKVAGTGRAPALTSPTAAAPVAHGPHVGDHDEDLRAGVTNVGEQPPRTPTVEPREADPREHSLQGDARPSAPGGADGTADGKRGDDGGRSAGHEKGTRIPGGPSRQSADGASDHVSDQANDEINQADDANEEADDANEEADDANEEADDANEEADERLAELVTPADATEKDRRRCASPVAGDDLDPPLRFRLNTPYPIKSSPGRFGVIIEPLPLFGCSAECRDLPACNGYSIFDVAVVGEAIVPAHVTPRRDGAYEATFTIPFSGYYEIRALLNFFNYTNVYRHYWSRPQTIERLEFDPEYRKEFGGPPGYSHITHSPRHLQLNVPPTERKQLPACGDVRPTTMGGWWDGAVTRWTPHDCTLRRLDESKDYDDLRVRFGNGRWLRLLGDSNTRNLFHYICDRLGGNVSTLPELGEQQYSVKSCALPNRGVITFSMWWPESNVDIVSRHLRRSLLSDLMRTMPSDKAEALAKLISGASDLAFPQATLLAVGSHSPQNMDTEHQEFRVWLRDYRELLDEHAKRSQIFVMLTSASSIRWLLHAKQSFLYYTSYLQNNARLEVRNARVVEAVRERATIIDAMSVSRALSTLNLLADAVHMQPTAYAALADIIANML